MTRRPASNRSGYNRDSGFTLLEILVALAIMSIALVVVFQLFSANMKGIAASGGYVRATMIAESRMREILDDDKIAPKSWSDVTDDGHQVDAVVTAVEEKRTENLQVTLLRIDVTVHWTSGLQERKIRLETLKLIKKQV